MFISFRFGEALAAAQLLKAALHAHGISTFLCEVPAGDSIEREIVRALHASELVVILGTATYGLDTGVGCSTYEELRFVLSEKKRFFLVKMCDDFALPETRFRLSKAISHFSLPWTASSTIIPEALVSSIITKLAASGVPFNESRAASVSTPLTPHSSSSSSHLMTPTTSDDASIALLLRMLHSRVLDSPARAEERSQLDVYVPLRFGFKRPPLGRGDAEGELEALMDALLLGSRRDVGALLGRRGEAHGVVLQGAAGTGKSLFGWRMMQRFDCLAASRHVDAPRSRIPVVVTLPLVRDDVMAAMTSDKAADMFLLRHAVAAYQIPGLLERVAGLPASQLAEVFEESFVFVLDGVDELVDKLPIYRLYNMAAWRNSLFVVTCRTGFYSDDGEAMRHAVDLRGSGVSMVGIHLLPFSPTQVQQYIEVFAADRERAVHGWGAQQYRDALGRFPQLGDFLQEPLLVYLVLNVLPLLMANYSPAEPTATPGSHGGMRLSRFYLQVFQAGSSSVGVHTPDVFPVLKRAELYSLFVHAWAEREARKRGKMEERKFAEDVAGDHGGAVDKKFVKRVVAFCEKIAFEMFLHDKTQYAVSKSEPPPAEVDGDSDGEFDVDSGRAEARASKGGARGFADTFLEEMLAGREEEFRCSPLRRSGNAFSFLHKTVQEYFAAMHVMRELGMLKAMQARPSSKRVSLATMVESGDVSSLAISGKLLTAGNVSETLRFCADMVDGGVQHIISGLVLGSSSFPPQAGHLYDSLSSAHAHEAAITPRVSATDSLRRKDQLQPSTLALWDIVQASRSSGARRPEAHLSTAIAAANAMMVLNAGGMVFCGCNLSNATLGPSSDDLRGIHPDQRHFMDVSGGVFDRANLTGSILIRARLDGCSFRGACFDKVDARHVDFGQLPMLLGHTSSVYGVCVTFNGKHVVSGSADNTVRVWSLETGTCLRILSGHTALVKCVCLTPDANHVLSGSYDNTIRVWSLDSGDCVHVLNGHTEGVTCVVYACSPNASKKYVVSASVDKTIRVWSLENGDCLRTLCGHTSAVWTVCVSFDGKFLVSGSEDTRLWSLESGDCLRAFSGQGFETNCACFCSEDKVVSGSRDDVIRVWSVRSGDCLLTLSGHTSTVRSVCISPDGKYVISGSEDKTARVWSLDSGDCVRVLSGHTDWVLGVYVSPNGKYVVSASGDWAIRVWSLDSGALFRSPNGHTSTVKSVYVSPDGNYVVSGSLDNTIRVWSLDSGDLLRILTGHTAHVFCVCVSADSKLVVSGSVDKTIRVWSLENGDCFRTLCGHTSSVWSACVSPDGKHVVSGSDDDTVRIWLMKSGDCLRTLRGHASLVWSVSISPDGKMVVSGSADKTVRIWSMATGDCLHTLTAHTSDVKLVCVSPDGSVVTKSSDKTLVWSLDGVFLRVGTSHDNSLLPAGTSSRVGSFAFGLRASGEGSIVRIRAHAPPCTVRMLGTSSVLSFVACCCVGVACCEANARLLRQLGADPWLPDGSLCDSVA